MPWRVVILIVTAWDQLLRVKLNLRHVFGAIRVDGDIRHVAFVVGLTSPKRVT